MPVDSPVQAPRHRVRVFVDFWNYTLSMRNAEAEFRTDWVMLGPVLAHAAAGVVDVGAASEYQGLSFYGSHDPAREADRRLHHIEGRTHQILLALNEVPNLVLQDQGEEEPSKHLDYQGLPQNQEET